jgi:hypothetical protein
MMEQFLFWLKIGLFALACILMFAGERFHLPALIFLGTMSLGILSLFLGVEVIIKREASFRTRRAESVIGSESYSGCAAQVWGFMFILFGLGLALGALAGLIQPQQARTALERALETPLGWGILSAILGVFIFLYGLARILAGGAAISKNAWSGLRDAGYRMFGGLCLLFGGGLIGLGLILITSPETIIEYLQHWKILPP